VIRTSVPDDLDALVAIENRAFVIDRFSRRSFRYLLTKANAETLVDERDGKVCGYAMLLFNVGTSLARLYSLAIDPEYQGKGVGHELITAAEQVAIERNCITLRLEIRKDNIPSISFFKKHGYKQFDVLEDYYEDHMEGLRYEKSLGPQQKPDLMRVPYYEQTLDFTCGPAALMMAMKAIDPAIDLNRKLELRIWRESTTIFMTSGHGGCGPYGMALAAYHRGFDVEIYVNDERALFIDSVRSAEKKEVMRLVQEDFIDELSHLPIMINYRPLGLDEMYVKFDKGGVPIVLISSYRIYHEKFPHWVVVTGYDDRYIYVHDPFVDYEASKSSTDCIDMPILSTDFQRMTRYGKAGQKAVLILKPRKGKRNKTHH
jgi:ribosomal-protein-alanine acetyltransferase